MCFILQRCTALVFVFYCRKMSKLLRLKISIKTIKLFQKKYKYHSVYIHERNRLTKLCKNLQPLVSNCILLCNDKDSVYINRLCIEEPITEQDREITDSNKLANFLNLQFVSVLSM